MIKYWYLLLTNLNYWQSQRLHFRLFDIILNRRPRRLKKDYLQHIAKYYSKNSGLSIKYFVNQLRKKGFR